MGFKLSAAVFLILIIAAVRLPDIAHLKRIDVVVVQTISQLCACAFVGNKTIVNRFLIARPLVRLPAAGCRRSAWACAT